MTYTDVSLIRGCVPDDPSLSTAQAVMSCRCRGKHRTSRCVDVFVDDATGEVYPKLPDGSPADGSIGNLYDYLPEAP